MRVTLEHGGVRLCDRIRRREWLAAGTLGLGLAGVAGAESSAIIRPRAKAVVQLYLWGGPGAQETWDLKLDAPAGTRGDFRPIASAVPGVQYCEHLPLMALRAERYTIVRSLTHTGINHGTSTYHMLTGHIHPSPGTLRHPTKNDMPNLGCNAARFLPHPPHLPGYVSLPSIVNDGDKLPVPGQDAGILGEAHLPFKVLGDLTQRDFRVPALNLAEGLTAERMQRRVSLAEAVARQAESLGSTAVGREVDASFQRAVRLLSSRETQIAFDLSREPDAVREKYGWHHFAQSLVLTRRLIEAGVPYITVYWNSPDLTTNESWDTHANMHVRMKDHLLPAFDRSMSVFLDELHDRGLLDQTLVTWFGEFGRTPKINRNGGRDHWGFCQSIGLAGGGIRPGMAYGTSTEDGGYAATCPVSPDDLSATVLHCLGIDHRQHLYDLGNRPIPLSYGEPVQDLLL